MLEMHEEILARRRKEVGGGCWSARQTRRSIEEAGAGVAEV